ncbi:aldolase/citrate lyase family protein [Candidatus Thioglobus sp.]|nr:aldolase/citrate lyase family protein [Candidatus Thioglobus sp.]
MNKNTEQRITLKKKMKNREKMFAGWVSYAHPSITETFALAGFDFIAIDMEHSTITTEQAQRIIAASQAQGVPCLPRPVSHSNDWIKPLLESGADGMLIQMVNNKEELQNIIQNIYYPPIGNRSYGVNRAHDYGFSLNEYFSEWNESTSFIIQIESIEAVNNIDDLLEFDEVDGVMIGPMDLSGSLGIPGQTNHPSVIEASKKVIKACEKYQKSCGTQVSDTTEKAIEDLFDLGYTFAILGSDLFVLWRWAEKMKNIMEKLKQ